MTFLAAVSLDLDYLDYLVAVSVAAVAAFEDVVAPFEIVTFVDDFAGYLQSAQSP